MKNKALVKKIFNIILCSILLCSSWGCGSKEEEVTVDLSALNSAMLAADTSLPEMSSIDSDMDNAESNLAYLADKLDYDLVDGYFYSYSKTGTAHEIAVIHAKDSSGVNAIKLALQAHIESRIHTFENYSPDEVDAAQNAIVISNGNYVAMIMCDNQDAVQQVFMNETK
jgi:hypothetical protein